MATDVWGGPAELARNTREVTAAFIAAGIDPKKHIVFNQSQVTDMPSSPGSSTAWRALAGLAA
jgi:tryptophanyl-tRNA synthetase